MNGLECSLLGFFLLVAYLGVMWYLIGASSGRRLLPPLLPLATRVWIKKNGHWVEYVPKE